MPLDQDYWRYVEATAQEMAHRFGYQRIDTPIFEDAGLFVRSIGEVTDIVQKEIYTFADRSDDMITLRPEGTAPVCRAYLEHGMHNLPQPVRLYYFCPIFRYERPQAGRFRQHHQFGIEALGDGDPSVDSEVIEVGWRLLLETGLKDLSLLINSIGDPQCRPDYLRALKDYYADYVERICKECRLRLERNPMRLLDCKEESCQPIIAGAPHATEYLCNQCREHWDGLLSYLTVLDLPYQVDHRLVRGFDYYTRTVFEIQPQVGGAQSTILGGGRYDGLIQELGGRPTPGVGFGMGIERVILNLKGQNIGIPEGSGIKVLIAFLGDPAKQAAVMMASELRKQEISAVLAPAGKSLKGQMRHASALGASYVIIIGEDELKRGTVIVRDMAKGEQKEVAKEDVGQTLA